MAVLEANHNGLTVHQIAELLWGAERVGVSRCFGVVHSDQSPSRSSKRGWTESKTSHRRGQRSRLSGSGNSRWRLAVLRLSLSSRADCCSESPCIADIPELSVQCLLLDPIPPPLSAACQSSELPGWRVSHRPNDLRTAGQ